jgi:hypothetical protein
MKTINDGIGEKRRYGARIVAFFLLGGGLLGMLGSAVTLYHSAQQHRLLAGVSGVLSTVLFAWCIAAGVALWRTTPNGFKWAKLLFAMLFELVTLCGAVEQAQTKGLKNVFG